MPNIFLTGKCNLKCPYCFADDFVNKDCSEISLENFNKVVDFLKKEGPARVGLIGGEPLLYPHLNEVLETLKNDEKIEGVTVYTNGIALDKYIENLSHSKIALLINCNSPDNIGSNYEKLKHNIELVRDAKINFTLGINLYSESMNYSYIFDLLKLADKKELRFSPSLSNEQKEETEDILDSFKKIKPLIMSFFKDCLENKVVPYYDCNSLPDCIFDIEDIKIMVKLSKLADEFKIAFCPIRSCRTCTPVLDIFPDLTVGRCFGLAKYYRVPLSNFKCVSNIEKYFFNEVDMFARLSFISKKCPDCKLRLLSKCGVCFSYKLKQIDRLKEVCSSFAAN